jgi:hypothetical protein
LLHVALRRLPAFWFSASAGAALLHGYAFGFVALIFCSDCQIAVQKLRMAVAFRFCAALGWGWEWIASGIQIIACEFRTWTKKCIFSNRTTEQIFPTVTVFSRVFFLATREKHRLDGGQIL